MGGIGVPVAELFATLGLDSTRFTQGITLAESRMHTAADTVSVDAKKMRDTLNTVASQMGIDLTRAASATDVLTVAFSGLAKSGVTVRDSVMGVNVALNDLARKEAVMAEIEGEVIAQLTWSEKLRKADAKAALEQAAAIEKAALAQQKSALAQERALLFQGAYATGGYQAGHLARLVPGGMAGPAIGAAVAAGATYELIKWTNEASDAALATRNLSVELGISFEQSRRLQEMSHIMGTELHTLTQGAWHLAQAMDGGTSQSKRLTGTLQELGVEGSSSGELLMSFLQKLSEIPDTTKRIALAHEVMGRASYAIIPLISNYKELTDTVQRLGPIIGPETQDKLVDNAKRVHELGVEWDRLKQDIASTIGLPVEEWLIKVAKRLRHPNGEPEIDKSGRLGETKHDSFLKTPPILNMPGVTIPSGMALFGQQSAEAFAAKHETLESLQTALGAAKTEEKDALSALSRKINPLIPGSEEYQKELGKYTEAVADVKKFTGQIKDMESQSDSAKLARESRLAEHHQRLTQAQLEMDFKSLETIDLVDDESINRQRDRELDLNGKIYQSKEKLTNQLIALDQKYNRGLETPKLKQDLEQESMATFARGMDIVHKAEAEKKRIYDEEMARRKRAQEANERDDEAAAKRREEALRQQHNDQNKADQAEIKAKADHKVRLLDMDKEESKFLEDQGILTQAQRLTRERDIDQREFEIKRDALQKEINLINEHEAKVEGIDVTEATRRQAFQTQLAVLTDQYAAKQQKHSEEERKGLDSITQAINEQIVARRKLLNEQAGANDRLVQLENERIKTWAVKQQTQGLGHAYGEFLGVAKSGLKGLNSELAQAFLGSKSLHDAWQSAIKSVGASMIEFTLDTIEKMAAAAVIKLLGIKATSTVVGASEINIGAAVGAANAMASIAMIPIVGPAMAPAAGAAMYATILAQTLPLLTTSTFEYGGDVPRDMFAMVHGGEHVVNSHLTRALEGIAAKGGMDSGGGMYLDFRGATFGSGMSQSTVDNMMQVAVSKLRRAAGGLPTKTGRL